MMEMLKDVHYLQSTTQPKIRFKILGRDKATNIMRLKGDYAEFDEFMDKATMAMYGYKITSEEVQDVSTN